jgi:phospholipid transport system substrate-binding protein
VENPTAVVSRLLAAISQAGTAKQDQLVSRPHPRDASMASATPTLLDIPGISRRTLGQHWETRSSTEQQEFIALFSQLLAQVAFPKSAVFFRSLETTATTERISGRQAAVHTTLRHATEGQIAVDYVLVRPSDTWQIHDVLLDGVSLVTNLQAQFNQIITQHSYAELLRRLHKKLAQATLQAAR